MTYYSIKNNDKDHEQFLREIPGFIKSCGDHQKKRRHEIFLSLREGILSFITGFDKKYTK